MQEDSQKSGRMLFIGALTVCMGASYFLRLYSPMFPMVIVPCSIALIVLTIFSSATPDQLPSVTTTQCCQATTPTVKAELWAGPRGEHGQRHQTLPGLVPFQTGPIGVC